MGIGVDDLILLNHLWQAGYLRGERSIAEIGAQQLADTFLAASDSLAETAQLFGAVTAFARPQPSADNSKCLVREAPLAQDFWHWLGFRYVSIDLDDMADSVPLDLNFDSVPPELDGSFSLVTNFGTTEHVANQMNAFKIIHDLAAPDALMFHHLPFQGMLNHGLINYNMKFFWMLCRSNNYRIVLAIFSGAGETYRLPQNIIDTFAPINQAILERVSQYQFVDSTLIMVLQKVADTPYIPPVDVPNEVWHSNSPYMQRYRPSTIIKNEPPQSDRGPRETIKEYSSWDLQRELASRCYRRALRCFGVALR